MNYHFEVFYKHYLNIFLKILIDKEQKLYRRLSESPNDPKVDFPYCFQLLKFV